MKQKIIDVLIATLLANQDTVDEFEKIKDFLTPHNGKRITTHLEKKLPEGMKMETGRKYVVIKIIKSNREHEIAYTSDKTVDINKFQQLDSAYSSAAIERINKLKAILDNPERLDEIIRIHTKMKEGYDQLKKEYKKLNDCGFNGFHNPASHAILTALDITWDVVSKFG